MRRLLRQTLLLLGLAFLPAIGQALYLRGHVSWDEQAIAEDEVTLEQVRAWSDAVLWVDARPDEPFAHQPIPGAVSLNEDRWGELLPQTLTAWSPENRVVVYCSS